MSSETVEGPSLARVRPLCPCQGLLAVQIVASAGQWRQHLALVDLAGHWYEAVGSHLPSSVTHDSYFAVAAAASAASAAVAAPHPGHAASAAVALAY